MKLISPVANANSRDDDGGGDEGCTPHTHNPSEKEELFNLIYRFDCFVR